MSVKSVKSVNFHFKASSELSISDLCKEHSVKRSFCNKFSYVPFLSTITGAVRIFTSIFKHTPGAYGGEHKFIGKVWQHITQTSYNLFRGVLELVPIVNIIGCVILDKFIVNENEYFTLIKQNPEIFNKIPEKHQTEALRKVYEESKKLKAKEEPKKSEVKVEQEEIEEPKKSEDKVEQEESKKSEDKVEQEEREELDVSQNNKVGEEREEREELDVSQNVITESLVQDEELIKLLESAGEAEIKPKNLRDVVKNEKANYEVWSKVFKNPNAKNKKVLNALIEKLGNSEATDCKNLLVRVKQAKKDLNKK